MLVGVQNGRVVATQGDPDSAVNRGLNYIKGDLLAVSWNEAFDVMASNWKESIVSHGPNSVAMFGPSQWTIWEGYAASKHFKAGFRTNHLDPDARHCMASGVPVDKLKAVAELYADPKTRVVSFWNMGFNQHTRATWVNNMIYNVHLLVGKISESGHSPFSLTGQPSACAGRSSTARRPCGASVKATTRTSRPARA